MVSFVPKKIQAMKIATNWFHSIGKENPLQTPKNNWRLLRLWKTIVRVCLQQKPSYSAKTYFVAIPKTYTKHFRDVITFDTKRLKRGVVNLIYVYSDRVGAVSTVSWLEMSTTTGTLS